MKETLMTNNNTLIVPEREITTSVNRNFIEANTKNVSLSHLKRDCTIPVFSKDNECTISHQEFIDVTMECAHKVFEGHGISIPDVRVSHVIKGRTPSAIGKPVKELREDEKTIYYERMMFAIEIPTISETVNGNTLKLTVGGVRAYNQENLYSRKTFEKFKIFIGFQNMVCTNLCISSDGYAGDLRAGSLMDLKEAIIQVFGRYTIQSHLKSMAKMSNNSLTESQFAQLIGRARPYNYVPKNERMEQVPLGFSDSQINTIARDYYGDTSFCRNDNGNINLWKLYNLFTGANKSSYIDSFLPRGANAYEFVQTLGKSLENNSHHWFLQ